MNFDEPCPGWRFSSACSVKTLENGIPALNFTEWISRKTQLILNMIVVFPGHIDSTQ